MNLSPSKLTFKEAEIQFHLFQSYVDFNQGFIQSFLFWDLEFWHWKLYFKEYDAVYDNLTTFHAYQSPFLSRIKIACFNFYW